MCSTVGDFRSPEYEISPLNLSFALPKAYKLIISGLSYDSEVEWIHPGERKKMLTKDFWF